MRLAFVAAIGAALALASCSHTTVVGCPPVADYPLAFQQQASAELKVLEDLEALPIGHPLRQQLDAYLKSRGRSIALPAGLPALDRLMDDFKKMRDQARACAKSG